MTLFIIAGCTGQSAPPVSETTLYRQLGGEQGLEQLVDAFIRGIADDDRIFPYFAKADVTHFREGFVTHLCDIADGPCTYDGDSMEQIHTGMHIDEADFNRVVEILVDAMQETGIGYRTQNRLLARLAPLREGVIHR